jgi:hypothetical protein
LHVASCEEIGVGESLDAFGQQLVAGVCGVRMLMTTASITPRFGELAGDLAAGTGDGRAALVLLPGLTFDRTMWRPALRSLRTIDPGRTTLALDMPGEGERHRRRNRELARAADALHARPR